MQEFLLAIPVENNLAADPGIDQDRQN